MKFAIFPIVLAAILCGCGSSDSSPNSSTTSKATVPTDGVVGAKKGQAASGQATFAMSPAQAAAHLGSKGGG